MFYQQGTFNRILMTLEEGLVCLHHGQVVIDTVEYRPLVDAGTGVGDTELYQIPDAKIQSVRNLHETVLVVDLKYATCIVDI